MDTQNEPLVKSQSEVEIGDNNTIVLGSPTFTEGDDNEKMAALTLWSTIVGHIRGMHGSIKSHDSKMQIVSSLKDELGTHESNLIKAQELANTPGANAVAPYQATPPAATQPAATGTQTDGVTFHTPQATPATRAYESLKKKVFITREAWENSLKANWPEATKSTAFSIEVQYVVEDHIIASFNPRLRNGFVKINETV